MALNYKVPFYSNTPDDTHCFQASLRMVLGYFLPKKTFSWKELEKITAKKPGLWTWATAGLLWLNKKGFEVHDIEDFDYNIFAEQGEKYLVNMFGVDVAREQVRHSDLRQEKRLAVKLAKTDIVKKVLPNFLTIKKYLREGFLVMCNVNALAMEKKKGYAGHFIVITGYDAKHLILHDPGLPARAGRKVLYDDFKRAWSYPDRTANNLIAVRLIRER